MRIAVIGATGMLGCHTAHAVVERGHELVVIHRASSKLDQLGALAHTTHTSSLATEVGLLIALEGVDAVIHAAAYTPSAPRAWKKEIETARDQMGLFLSACKKANARHPLRVVYVGAAIALQRDPNGAAGNETHSYPAQPTEHNSYVQVKWAMDAMALQAAADGLHTVIGIPTMCFGEYDGGNSAGSLVRDIARGTLPGYVPGECNVVYAGDAARGLVLCAEKGRSGERYLITGKNTSMDDLVHMIAAQAGMPAPRVTPLRLARLVATLGAIRYRWFGGAIPKLTESAVAVMGLGQFVDGSKAQEELGYTPTLPLSQTIERSLAWFRARC